MTATSEAIAISRASTLKPKPRDSELSFGTVFTDHMFMMDYDRRMAGILPAFSPMALLHWIPLRQSFTMRRPSLMA